MPSAKVDKAQGPSTFWLTRWLFLRALALVFLVAYLSLIWQFKPLLGSDGLMPVALFLSRVKAAFPGWGARLRAAPSLFWLANSDGAMLACAWLGAALSAFSVVFGGDAPVWAAIWALYASFVHVGQLFYGYGWETMMIEAGFLAIFLAPPLRLDGLSPKDPPPRALLWLYRWMLFRVMFGAGLIKLRGDSCWRNLTCLYYHFETQPIPNPLSPWFSRLPHAVLRGGVLFNHLAELLAPWLLFAPRVGAAAGGAVIVAFQLVLIASGNLSWLNWLTIALCLPAFDDSLLGRILPKRLAARVPARADAPSRARTGVVWALVALVAVLSVAPIQNLLSPRQAMNASFDPIGLVNAYGAFGSVGRRRLQLVLEGTDDPLPGEGADWKEYRFRCQPGPLDRRPCVISPFQPRLDWQAWFAAMSDYRHEPWLVYFVCKLLAGDRGALSLLAPGPFEDRPPRYIRAVLYRYRFAPPGGPDWWTRRRLGLWLPPVSLSDPGLRAFARDYASR